MDVCTSGSPLDGKGCFAIVSFFFTGHILLSCRVLCCGVVLVVPCVVLFLLCVCVYDLFLFSQVTYALRRAAGDAAVERTSPIALPKAIKNEKEIVGMQTAHNKDGAALASFFAWLEKCVCTGGTPTEKEIAVKVKIAF